MTKVEVFTKLSDCVNELERALWDLPHDAARMRFEKLIDQLDALIDAVMTIDDRPYHEENT